MYNSKKLYFLALSGVALLAVLASWSGLEAALQPAAHPVGTACATCHVAGQNVTAQNARMLTNSQENLCGGCHKDAIRVSHPTGFNPGRPMPADYPVDWKGDLTCSTCHEPHGDFPGKLRGTERGKPMCLKCHDTQFFAGMRDGGQSLVVSGHLSLDQKTVLKSLDPFSVNCMGCHGQQGDSDAVQVDSQLVVRHGAQQSVNHPIGRDYDTASRYGGYRPKSMLSKKILLPNGRIGCISCHEGYSKEHGKLLMPRGRSALCMECHDL